MNPLVVPVTSAKFKLAFLHTCVMTSEYFNKNFSVFGQIENL